MSTRARKERKRAGTPFSKAQKAATPIGERTSTRLAGERLLTKLLRGSDPEAVAKQLEATAKGQER